MCFLGSPKLQAAVTTNGFVILEGPASAPAPERKGLSARFGLEREGQFEKAAIDRCTIIVRKLH